MAMRMAKCNRFNNQNNNFARASRFLVHTFVVIARLGCETSLFHVLWKMLTQGKILICPACVKIFSTLCKAKRSFKPYPHQHDSEIQKQARMTRKLLWWIFCSTTHPWDTSLKVFMIFRENFPSEMKPGKCSAKKKTNKKGQKSEKKSEGEEAKG